MTADIAHHQELHVFVMILYIIGRRSSVHYIIRVVSFSLVNFVLPMLSITIVVGSVLAVQTDPLVLASIQSIEPQLIVAPVGPLLLLLQLVMELVFLATGPSAIIVDIVTLLE